MSGPTASDLTARLRGHVPRRFASAGSPWWGPPDDAGLPDRAAVVERLALLVATGQPVHSVIATLQADRRDQLAGPAERLDAGAPIPDAVRAWARSCGCGDLGSLAVELQRAVATDQVVAALDDAAARLRRRADEALAARAVWRARVVMLAAVTSTATSVLLVLS